MTVDHRPTPRHDALLDTLARASEGLEVASVFDPWSMQAEDDALADAATARRARLRQHLDRPARLILVGEACGYAGARMSGVPFTSEALILDGAIPGVTADAPRLSTRRNPWREPSATVVWRALHRAGLAEFAVLWNGFPWHPHPPGQPLGNRTPGPRERTAGLAVLATLVALYPGAIVGGVGAQACAALRELAIDHHPLRHPARGGATLFSDGVHALMRDVGATLPS